MAIVRAVKSGNWSDTTVWNTGALPTSADDVYSNTFTVTIDTSPTVLSVRNTSATGVTAGGSFVSTNNSTLTCTGAGILTGAANCFISNLTLGQTCSIVSNAAGGVTFNCHAIVNTNSGLIQITGNMTGGAAGYGGAGSYAVHNTGQGTVAINGDIFGGSGDSVGVNNAGSGTITATGSITGGSGLNGYGIRNSSSGVLTLTGTVTAGSASLTYGAFNASSGTMTIVGSAQATNLSPAIGSQGTSAVIILSGPFLTSANGTHAIFCPNWKWQNTTPPATYYQIRSANLSVVRPIYTADSVGGNPTTSNVRLGTVYGPSNELTGTLSMPTAQSVSYGVPVDNTTGTAALNAVDIWNYPLSGITTSGSIGERLKNAATINSVSQQISDAFSST